jgi:hypothetical protein
MDEKSGSAMIAMEEVESGAKGKEMKIVRNDLHKLIISPQRVN